jgi:hypothetical protein
MISLAPAFRNEAWRDSHIRANLNYVGDRAEFIFRDCHHSLSVTPAVPAPFPPCLADSFWLGMAPYGDVSNIAHKTGTHHNLKYWSSITATFGQLPVTESVVLPPLSGTMIMKISEKYRSKALACEKLAQEVLNYDFRCAWTEIAIE